MDVDALVQLAREALWTGVLISLPIAGAALLVGLVVAAVQTATQIHDPAVVQLPRLLVVAAVLSSAGVWMGEHVARLASQVFGAG